MGFHRDCGGQCEVDAGDLGCGWREFYFYWSAAGQPTFHLGTVDHFDSAAPSTRNDKWFYVAMGSQGGKSHGVVTLKGNPTQFEIEWAGVVMMLGTTTLKGPVGDTTFTVRDM